MALDLRGVRWQSAHPELLARCYSALSFLADFGFRYFLPAYLRADLLGYESNAGPVFHLTYGQQDCDLHGYSIERFLPFDRAERVAIIHYLEFKARDKYEAAEINQALERYWRPSVHPPVP
jgi:hypothetical protein